MLATTLPVPPTNIAVRNIKLKALKKLGCREFDNPLFRNELIKTVKAAVKKEATTKNEALCTGRSTCAKLCETSGSKTPISRRETIYLDWKAKQVSPSKAYCQVSFDVAFDLVLTGWVGACIPN